MKNPKTIYRVSLDDLPGHIFYFECKDKNDLNHQVTKRFGIGITYTFEIDNRKEL